GRLINWKLPVGGFKRLITIVLTVPACRLSVASLPEIRGGVLSSLEICAIIWRWVVSPGALLYMTVYALEPLVTVLKGVASRNPMLVCTTVVDPLPGAPFNTS